MTDSQQPSLSRERDVAGDLDLRRLVDIIVGGKWIIAAAIGVSLILAQLYLWTTQPVYRADALLQIQSEGGGAMQGLMELEKQLGGESRTRAAAEIRIIRSRAVLGEVVDRLDLQTVARPQYFPVIGEAVANLRGWSAGSDGNGPKPAWLGHYAWSRAAVDLGQLDVPEALKGQALTLTALGGDRYRLHGPEGETLLEGRVGQTVSAETPHGPLTVFVADIRIGNGPVDFTVSRRSWLGVVRGLGARLSITEQGQDTGIVELALEGTDREHITRVVNAIAETYLRQNVEAKTEEAEKSLAFLEEQLPELRAQLREAENKLSRFQQKRQAVNLDSAGQALLNRAVELEQRLLEMDLKRNELLQRYKPGHPQLESLREQMEEIRGKRSELEDKISDLPEIQREIIGLRRDVEVNTALYTSLLNRAQELRVIKAGTVGNVRIVDSAVKPISPVKPRKDAVLILALFAGGTLGVGGVLGRALLRRGITNPDEIEEATGLPVYGVVPFSTWQQRSDRRARSKGGALKLLARHRPDDVVTESLRSLRTSLHFAQMEADRNLFLITGPAPGIGKSFISANLAVLLAEAGRRVLLIDGDMRRGHLHRYIDADRSPGFSEILSGQIAWRDAVRTVENGTRIDAITTGELPPNPTELLMRPATVDVLGEMRRAYDLVILDGPPILAVTDSTIMAAHDAITFLVAYAGETQMPEIQSAQKRLAQQHSTRLAGVILNGLRESDAKTYGAYYGYYQYSYKQK